MSTNFLLFAVFGIVTTLLSLGTNSIASQTDVILEASFGQVGLSTLNYSYGHTDINGVTEAGKGPLYSEVVLNIEGTNATLSHLTSENKVMIVAVVPSKTWWIRIRGTFPHSGTISIPSLIKSVNYLVW
ncbi:MAG: hypothetical protein N2513_01970 [Deltaproteobacteria bacterium]|nr:hypothetical protein [Deltaproteobacteria bacterium]